MQAPDRQITAVAQSLDMVYELELGQGCTGFLNSFGPPLLISSTSRPLQDLAGKLQAYTQRRLARSHPSLCCRLTKFSGLETSIFASYGAMPRRPLIDLEDKAVWLVPIATSESWKKHAAGRCRGNPPKTRS